MTIIFLSRMHLFFRPQIWAVCALTALLLLSGCGKKSEAEQLAQLRNSMLYSKYHLLSTHSLPLALKSYQMGIALSEAKDMPPLTEQHLCLTRVMMAYGAIISDKRTIALAEADLVEQANCALFEQAAAMSLQAVVFHREAWPTLAKERTNEAKKLLAGHIKGNENQEKILLLHTTMAVVGVMEKNPQSALVHVDAIALLLEQPWLGKLSKAIFQLNQGNVTDGLREIKRLSEDASVPIEVRKKLQEGVAQIEAKTGNIDAPAFLTRVLVTALWEAVKTKGPQTFAVIANFVDKQLNRTINTGVNAAKTLWSEIGGGQK